MTEDSDEYVAAEVFVVVTPWAGGSVGPQCVVAVCEDADVAEEVAGEYGEYDYDRNLSLGSMPPRAIIYETSLVDEVGEFEKPSFGDIAFGVSDDGGGFGMISTPFEGDEDTSPPSETSDDEDGS
jgi:hypothetical protein